MQLVLICNGASTTHISTTNSILNVSREFSNTFMNYLPHCGCELQSCKAPVQFYLAGTGGGEGGRGRGGGGLQLYNKILYNIHVPSISTPPSIIMFMYTVHQLNQPFAKSIHSLTFFFLAQLTLGTLGPSHQLWLLYTILNFYITPYSYLIVILSALYMSCAILCILCFWINCRRKKVQ